MKVLLYGGSFDPPHNGHLNNLRAAAARVRPDRIVVMPPARLRSSGNERFRCAAAGDVRLFFRAGGGGRLPGSNRERLGGAAGCAGEAELHRPHAGDAGGRIPGAELYLAIGSDMLLSFDGWYRWQDILRLARLVVTSRNVGDDPLLHKKAKQLDATGARILFAPVEALPMASSALRARLAAGERCENELPPLVRRVIQREGLYRETKGDEDSE